MRKLARALAVALLGICCYLVGLAFVAFMTMTLYVDVNLTGTPAWEECDDCMPFMSDEAMSWTMNTVAVYTAGCVGLVAYLVSRRRRHDRAGRVGDPLEEATT
jgi:hypothetical protein